MKGMKESFDVAGNSLLRLGLLVLSTVLILGGSIFFYNRLVYERALSVSGVGITGSGSTTQPGLNATPATILILAVSASLISLSVFGFLREVFRGKRNSKALGKELSQIVTVSLPLEIGPSLQVPSLKREWEEAPEKEDGKP